MVSGWGGVHGVFDGCVGVSGGVGAVVVVISVMLKKMLIA